MPITRPSVLTHVMSCVFQMISVERVMGYLDLEKEAPGNTDESPPWTNEGRIHFYTVNFRYTSDAPLLKNLSAVIKSTKVCLTQFSL